MTMHPNVAQEEFVSGILRLKGVAKSWDMVSRLERGWSMRFVSKSLWLCEINNIVCEIVKWVKMGEQSSKFPGYEIPLHHLDMLDEFHGELKWYVEYDVPRTGTSHIL